MGIGDAALPVAAAAAGGGRRGRAGAGFLPRAAARCTVRAAAALLRPGLVAVGCLRDFLAAADSLEPTTARGFFGRVTGFRREPNAGFLVATRRFDRTFALPAAFSTCLRTRFAALSAARARLSCDLTCFRCRLAALTPSRAFTTAELVLLMRCVLR